MTVRPGKGAALGVCLTLLVAAGIAVGCSGSNSVNYTSPGAPTTAPQTSVAVTIALPLTGTLSAQTIASVTVQAAASGVQLPPVTIETARGASNCSANSQTLTCTGSVNAPVGPAVSFDVVAYSKPNAGGTPLASGLVIQAISAGGSTLSINGNILATFALYIADLDVGLDHSYFMAGQPGTFTFTFKGIDVVGGTIVAPETYANPIQMSLPPTNVFGFIPQVGATPNYFNPQIPPVTAPGQTLNFAYNGLAPGFSPGPNEFTFPVSLAYVDPAHIHGSTTITIYVPTPSPQPSVLASLTPSPIPTMTPFPTPSPTVTPTSNPTFTPGPITATPSALYFDATGGPAQQFTASEQGVKSFNAMSLNTLIATVSPPSGTTFNVTAVGAGITEIVVSDSKGNQAGVLVYVTPIIINPQVHSRTRR